MEAKEKIKPKNTITLFFIFLVLKLTNYIDWSWWWITAPLWIGGIVAYVLNELDERKI